MGKDYIYLETTPTSAPAKYLVDGVFYLDLPEGFSFQITEQLGQLTDVNKLASSGVLDFSIPATDKNLWLFSDYISPNAEDRVYSPISVRCFGGGVMALLQDNMFFKGATETDIEVSVVDGDDFWLILMQEMKLNEIGCGSIVLNRSTLSANFNQWTANTADRKFWFPLVHYGKFYRWQDQFAGVVVEDFLPWISPRHLLTEGFRLKGWNIESPLFTLNWFQRLWVDVLATELDYVGKGSQYEVQVEGTFDQVFDWSDVGGVFYRTFLFQTENLDPSNSHQLVQVPGYPGLTSLFYNLSEIETEYRITMNITVSNEIAFPVKFDVVVWNFDTNQAIDGVYNLQLEASEEKDFELEWEFSLAHLQSYGFMIQNVSGIGNAAADSGTLIVRAGDTLRADVISNRLFRGDTIPVQSLINPDYGFLDFFKGIVHLVNGKFYTDHASRTVYLYPSEDTDVYNNIVEGFLRPPADAIDLTEKVVQGSRKVVVKDDDRYRYYQLKFADSNDPYITDRLGIPEKEALYSKDIDLLRGDKTEVQVLDNPFFEPTANILWNGLEIPAVWDNVNGERTRVHGARIVMAVGNYQQCLSNDPALATPGFWTFEYISRSFFPQASQRPERAYKNAVGSWVNSEESVVYGGAVGGNDDLYEQFWRHEILVRQYSKLFDFLVALSEADFINLDFRKRVVINYKEDKGLYRLLAKTDFRTNDLLPLNLSLQPEPSKLKTKL